METRSGFIERRIAVGVGAALLAALVLLGGCAPTGAGKPSVERMYVFDCGVNRTPDLSRWSPGVNVGRAWEFSDNCYLIKHASGLMLWDSGIADAVVAMPGGQTTPNGLINARRARTLLSQLAEAGFTPGDVTHLAFSHTHGDHVGNANYFTGSMLYMQQAEYDAAFGPEPAKFGFNPALYGKLRDNPVRKLSGDFDVFGDGSVVIISTPGHTPGHQSLLVRLPRTGVVVLSGDLVHYDDNWNEKRVPSMNFNRDVSSQSMDQVAALLKRENAQLWINHDKAQSDKVAKAPRFVE